MLKPQFLSKNWNFDWNFWWFEFLCQNSMFTWDSKMHLKRLNFDQFRRENSNIWEFLAAKNSQFLSKKLEFWLKLLVIWIFTTKFDEYNVFEKFEFSCQKWIFWPKIRHSMTILINLGVKIQIFETFWLPKIVNFCSKIQKYEFSGDVIKLNFLTKLTKNC